MLKLRLGITDQNSSVRSAQEAVVVSEPKTIEALTVEAYNPLPEGAVALDDVDVLYGAGDKFGNSSDGGIAIGDLVPDPLLRVPVYTQAEQTMAEDDVDILYGTDDKFGSSDGGIAIGHLIPDPLLRVPVDAQTEQTMAEDDVDILYGTDDKFFPVSEYAKPLSEHEAPYSAEKKEASLDIDQIVSFEADNLPELVEAASQNNLPEGAVALNDVDVTYGAGDKFGGAPDVGGLGKGGLYIPGSIENPTILYEKDGMAFI